MAYADDETTIYRLLHGYFLAADKHYAEGAGILAAVGKEQKNAKILESAVKIAIHVDSGLAREYAQLWQQYGGGVQARQFIAELYLQDGNLKAAESALARLMRDKAQSAADLYKQLYGVKDKAAALAMGKRLFPQDGDGQLQLVRLALSADNYPVAAGALAAGVQYDPRLTDLYFLQAYAKQRQTQDPKQALQSLEAYVAADCYQTAVNCVLPAVLFAYRDYLSGRHDWQEALITDKPDTVAWQQQAGSFYEQLELWQRAEEAYLAASSDFEARLGLARIAVDARQDIAAALAILYATEVREKQQFIVRELTIAHLLEKSEGVTAAIRRIIAARQTAQDSYLLMYNQALYHHENGDGKEAIELLLHITQLFPVSADAWNALGYIMADSNVDLQTAKAYIERALAEDPNNAAYLDSLGWVNYRLGDLNAARDQLQAAASLSDSAEIAAHFGEVLWKLNDFDGARRTWQKGLEKEPENEVLNETLRRYNPF